MIAYYTIPKTIRELQHRLIVIVRAANYTIPKTIRELQPSETMSPLCFNYTIPKTIRELQPLNLRAVGDADYTIPKTIRELQQHTGVVDNLSIIPYQKLSGNYNRQSLCWHYFSIIPYQKLSGNYNNERMRPSASNNYTIPKTIRELQLRAAFCFY